ncbi:hypothetical protein DPEC_G00086430 [Dallia pectoralis]|uniref:Uncharacterized protein n=1 Tax=Dallia pectoralis TaxID=75939 RepID=A0ACC2H0K1_DALPE|nr:hypothetical protein DPEC_G00086430 [Dallia pectoralis]
MSIIIRARCSTVQVSPSAVTTVDHRAHAYLAANQLFPDDRVTSQLDHIWQKRQEEGLRKGHLERWVLGNPPLVSTSLRRQITGAQ